MDKNILVIGAGGLAKELLFAFPEYEDRFVFFDDVTDNLLLYDKFKILKSQKELTDFFPDKFYFVVAVGTAKYREILFYKFKQLGGIPLTLVSKNAKIGKYDTEIGEGTLILDNAVITNSVKIGKGTLINKAVMISHDSVVGDFCDIAPGVRSGKLSMGNKVTVGLNATIIPSKTIGNNVTVGAGAVVIKDIPDNHTVVGNPGKIIKSE